jgi:ectoine hydroxylase-related dioxygenase (phytanoyl-CoA dioxygenase family)
MNELVVSNEILTDAAKLQSRLAEDGYLFFRGLLNAERLMELRREMLTLMQAGGWLVAGTDPVDGIANVDARSTEGDPGYTDVYHQVYRLQSFHEMAHSEEVLSVLKRLMDCPIMPLPQKVARLWFPKYTEHTTPTHQDFVHFQGTLENLTCWSPVGDCPRELGGLAVQRGSHKVGRVLDHQFSLGAGSLNLDADQFEELADCEWLTTDYQAGDTLVFPALTIHKALPNVTEDRLRVSLDNRYQRIGDPTAEHMLEPHLRSSSPLSWDEVYADWTNEELKYYWKQYDNPVHPQITTYMNAAFDEAVELANSGDDRAVLHRQRIAGRKNGTPQCVRATDVLAALGRVEG